VFDYVHLYGVHERISASVPDIGTRGAVHVGARCRIGDEEDAIDDDRCSDDECPRLDSPHSDAQGQRRVRADEKRETEGIPVKEEVADRVPPESPQYRVPDREAGGRCGRPFGGGSSDREEYDEEDAVRDDGAEQGFGASTSPSRPGMGRIRRHEHESRQDEQEEAPRRRCRRRHVLVERVSRNGCGKNAEKQNHPDRHVAWRSRRGGVALRRVLHRSLDRSRQVCAGQRLRHACTCRPRRRECRRAFTSYPVSASEGGVQ
jgi:hypothetical protein